MQEIRQAFRGHTLWSSRTVERMHVCMYVCVIEALLLRMHVCMYVCLPNSKASIRYAATLLLRVVDTVYSDS